MKKAVIAAAVAGAFAAPVAIAADFKSSMYWSQAISFGETTTTTNGVDSNVNNDTVLDGGGNQINLTWTDTLDNGIGLVANMSFAVNTTSGDATAGGTGLGNITSRNSYVGFSGDFGTVKIGTNEHFAETDLIFDPNLADEGESEPLQFIQMGITSFDFTRFDNDSIWWNSKQMNNFSAKAAYIFGKTAVAGVDPKGMQIGLDYANGPLKVGVSQATYEDYTDNGLGTAAVAGTEAQMTTLHGSYDMGLAVIKAATWSIEQTGTTTEAGISGYEVEGRSLYVGLPVGGGTLWAQSSSLGDRDQTVTATGVTSAVGQSGKDAISLGYLMPMNANVNMFARYNDADFDANFSGTGNPVEAEAVMFGWQLSY